jgi:predicted NodU family carbamoyl transferase
MLATAEERKRECLDNPAEHAAELLANGQLIGCYQGREECGSRALGNRSILYDPRDARNRDRVNNTVKFREPGQFGSVPDPAGNPRYSFYLPKARVGSGM